MAITFQDPIELETVNAARKQGERASYYSADQHADVEISFDFEAALILLPSSAKQECRQRLEQQNETSERVQKRDSVLKQALQKDLENANGQMAELQRVVSSLQGFKAAFQRFAEVGEIGMLIRDAQLGVDESKMAYDRALHRATTASILTSRVSNGSISSELEKERKSWTRVLLEYP